MDEKQKEELKAKTKEAARVTAKAIGQFAKWTYQKGKEGVEFYQQYQKEQEEQKRKMERQRKKSAEEQRIREEEKEKKRQIELEERKKKISIEMEEKRKKGEEKALAVRQLRHKKLCETLSEPLKVLEIDLKTIFKNSRKDRIDSFVDHLWQKDDGQLGKNVFYLQKEIKEILSNGAYHSVKRTINDFSDIELKVIKLLSYFNDRCILSDKDFAYMQLWLVYNNGKSTISQHSIRARFVDRCEDHELLDDYEYRISIDNTMMGVLNSWFKQYSKQTSIVVNEGLELIGEARAGIDDPPFQKTIEQELKGVEGWLKASDI